MIFPLFFSRASLIAPLSILTLLVIESSAASEESFVLRPLWRRPCGGSTDLRRDLSVDAGRSEVEDDGNGDLYGRELGVRMVGETSAASEMPPSSGNESKDATLATERR